MSLHREAATRRARIRDLLRVRTQDEPILEAPELLELLADPALSLRTVERDLKKIREPSRRNMSRGDMTSPMCARNT